MVNCRFSSTVSDLEEQIGEERERGKAAEQRIGRLSKEVWQKEEERVAAERTMAEKAGQREAAEARVKGLEAQVEEQSSRVSDWYGSVPYTFTRTCRHLP